MRLQIVRIKFGSKFNFESLYLRIWPRHFAFSQSVTMLLDEHTAVCVENEIERSILSTGQKQPAVLSSITLQQLLLSTLKLN